MKKGIGGGQKEVKRGDLESYVCSVRILMNSTRILSFVVGLCASLAAGSTYAFAVFAPYLRIQRSYRCATVPNMATKI